MIYTTSVGPRGYKGTFKKEEKAVEFLSIQEALQTLVAGNCGSLLFATDNIIKPSLKFFGLEKHLEMLSDPWLDMRRKRLP